jgi:hypothetical protein
MRNRPPRTDPPPWSERLYLRVPRPEIAYIRFVLESYDNLAFMSVLDRFEALLCLTFSPDQEAEVRDMVRSLAREIEIREIQVPVHDPRHPAMK